MTAWIVHVDSESHCPKIRESKCLVSFDFRSRGGILRFKVVTILDTLSGFLAYNDQ